MKFIVVWGFTAQVLLEGSLCAQRYYSDAFSLSALAIFPSPHQGLSNYAVEAVNAELRRVSRCFCEVARLFVYSWNRQSCTSNVTRATFH